MRDKLNGSHMPIQSQSRSASSLSMLPYIMQIAFVVMCLSVMSASGTSGTQPTWLTNPTVRTLIDTIFNQTERVDIVIGDQREGDRMEQVEYLVHGTGNISGILQHKSVRIYGQAFPEEEGCTGERSLLSARVQTDPSQKLDSLDTVDRDYDEEFELIKWDRSYETFVKIWDQNQHYGYVVLADLNVFETLMRCLLDPTGTYLIVPDSAMEFNPSKVMRLMKSVWSNQGVNRLFVLMGEIVYAFDPFRISNGTYGFLIELTDTLKIPSIPVQNFNGYPLKIDIFRSTYSDQITGKNGTKSELRGPDVVASQVFAKRLNFTAIRLPPDKDNFGVRLPNGSFNGAVGRLIRHESDIAFVGFFIKDYFSRDIEFTTGVYADELCCLVKKASRVPEYLLPITIFPPELWGLLFLAGIIFTVAWIIIRMAIQTVMSSRSGWKQTYRFAYLFNLTDEIRDAPLYHKLIQISIDTYILLLSATYIRFTRSGIERLLLFGILMVSLIITSLFQSGLSSVFVTPVYYKDISSLQQLDQSGYKIPVKYQGFMDDVFPSNYSSMMESLRNKMVLWQSNASLLAQVAQVGTISTVTRKTTLSLDNAIFITTRQLYMIPECPRTYNLAYVVPRHSVLLERINGLLLRMLNGGLINHWISAMNFNVTLNHREQIRDFEEPTLKVLTVLDMQFPFYLLVIGLGISTGVFIIELIYYRINHLPYIN
ncbi:uncharacterized protein LOC131428640 [Malaya genurostris]|uniref:uncharacterized protein LOC131428640 n=1 Tax=Malaya genurostris TaxID=325434 RepID=UPI0026F3D38F|nr:uncharacterized protein LOC131428640 [Malaya genurostris]